MKFKILLVLMLILTLLISCGESDPISFIIRPGISFGPIGPDTTEGHLSQLFGSENVKATSVELGEGEEETGTAIFPNDPEKTAEILWKDSSHGHIKEVRINGSKTNWRTEEGITLGTSLHELEKLNQGPVRMAGFDWDYSGTVIDCAGGKLAFLGINKGNMEIQGRTLLLRLDPGDYKSKSVSDEEFCAVVGDGDFISNSKDVMKKLNPTVYEIIAIFP